MPSSRMHPAAPFPRAYSCGLYGAGHSVYSRSAVRAMAEGGLWEDVRNCTFNDGFITFATASGTHRGWHHDYSRLTALLNRCPTVQWCPRYRLLRFGTARGTRTVLISIGDHDGTARCLCGAY